MAPISIPISIGKIVSSDSHVRYTCQVFGAGETAQPPEPGDYAFGSFVRLPLRTSPTRDDQTNRAHQTNVDGAQAAIAPASPPSGRRLARADVLTPTSAQLVATTWAVGLIYDTILVNPDFGTLGPRLSNDAQVELFSPDYLSERAVLVSILLLGTMAEGLGGGPRVRHGVPPIAPDLGAVVASMTDAEVRAFHVFADGAFADGAFADDAGPVGTRPYLHMGYLPHAIAQINPLLPVAMLHTVERLERLCPENAALLSIVKRNFAWRLKVETAG